MIGLSRRAKHRLKSGKGTAVKDLIKTFMTTSELYNVGLNWYLWRRNLLTKLFSYMIMEYNSQLQNCEVSKAVIFVFPDLMVQVVL